ncbi:Uncharacterised protein [Pseudomonas aeruginosa]|nr:Uncharacterised protein [Pseudomonas aeruginosa]
MSKLQHIGLFLFVLLSAGLALGYRVDCADGSHVETYLLRGLGAKPAGQRPVREKRLLKANGKRPSTRRYHAAAGKVPQSPGLLSSPPGAAPPR